MDRYIQGQICGSKWLMLSEKTCDKDIQIRNQINVEIENVSCVKSISFINNLKDGDPIPDIGVEQHDISVIYVYFPLGDGEAYLTTESLAHDFVCYAPYNWNAEKTYDKNQYGVYFKLFPTAGYTFEPREKMYFSITNMVTYGSLEKMVYVAVDFTSIFMEEGETQETPIKISEAEENANGTDFLACFKKRMLLDVVSFEATPARAAVGDTIKLSWVVGGDAVKCILTPGDLEVSKTGSIQTSVTEDTEFMIYAIGDDQQVSRSATVYIETPIIRSFTCSAKDNKIRYGDCVTFEYDVLNCYSIFMNQGIGRLTSKVFNVVPTLKSTDYTLCCKGPNGLIKQTITINITDFLEVKNVVFYRSKKSDGSYQYTLSWVILNNTSSKIMTSDGIVRSQDQQTGNITFTDSSGNALTVRFLCTGNGGQKIDNVYSV